MAATSTRSDSRLAAEVQAARKGRNYSRRELAADAEVSYSTLEGFELGRHGISVYTLRRIATVLGVTFTIGGS